MFEVIKNRLDALQVDWVGASRLFVPVSAVLVVLSWLSVGVIGPNWGIDFTGGTEIELAFEESIDIADLRETLSSIDIPSDAIQELGRGSSRFSVRIRDASFGADAVQTQVTDALVASFGPDWIERIDFSAEVGARFSVIYKGDRKGPTQVRDALAGLDGATVAEGREEREIVIKLPGLASQVEREIADAMGGRAFEVLSVDAVGPKVGDALKQQGIVSVLATLALVLLYIAFRFDIAYAPGAILALIHDVSLTIGVFVLIEHEFNLPIIGALLTIVGYSLNDTIVIFDRIRENRDRYARKELVEMINVSINETMSRTLATSFTTLVAVSAFLVLGNAVIADFVLALFFGIIFGTYSTIFVASPMILAMERIKPRLMALIDIEGSDDEDEGVDAFQDEYLTESEKRRRERARLAEQAESEDAG